MNTRYPISRRKKDQEKSRGNLPPFLPKQDLSFPFPLDLELEKRWRVKTVCSLAFSFVSRGKTRERLMEVPDTIHYGIHFAELLEGGRKRERESFLLRPPGNETGTETGLRASQRNDKSRTGVGGGAFLFRPQGIEHLTIAG